MILSDKKILFNTLAQRALVEYNMSDCDFMFIRHSENVTFKVESPELGSYLLRIHSPITKAMGTHGAVGNMVNSELLWLEALNQDTDLVLQKPVRNRSGALVTQVSTENGALPVNCSLMHWVDGQPYHRELESEQTAYQIGRILAKLHNHASQWKIPEGFIRPKRDIGYFKSVLRELLPAREDGRINPADYAIYETSIAVLTGMLYALGENRQTHGIMHADTHKGNMLYTDGAIHLIDFSFCAFGNFMYDLGICFSDMKENLHIACLEGYRSLRVLPENYPGLIEGFFIGSIIGTFSYWVANPRAQELLATKVPQIARDFAVKFNRGEYFWFQ